MSKLPPSPTVFLWVSVGSLALGLLAWLSPRVSALPIAKRQGAPAAHPSASNHNLHRSQSRPSSFTLNDHWEEAFQFDSYKTPKTESPTPEEVFFHGRYGIRSWNKLRYPPRTTPRFPSSPSPWKHKIQPQPLPLITDPDIEQPIDFFLENYPGPVKPCLKRAVTFVRYGAESDRFSLLNCDGSIAMGALERLSVLARPPKAPRPELPLPIEPDKESFQARGEWVPGVKMMHPRLIWFLQTLADAFPWKTFYLMSGYRTKGHTSFHGKGRAMDLFLMNVPNKHVYWYCRRYLWNGGCGFYPNNKFVHIDVRPPETGKVFWVDISGPGEPSRFVPTWPGVEKARPGTGSQVL
jgi:hypothetical protein